MSLVLKVPAVGFDCLSAVFEGRAVDDDADADDADADAGLTDD